NLQKIADMYLASRFGWLMVGLNSAELTSSRCECASLEEPRSPEPFVDSYASHRTGRDAASGVFPYCIRNPSIQVPCGVMGGERASLRPKTITACILANAGRGMW